jgi:hypothetical protein
VKFATLDEYRGFNPVLLQSMGTKAHFHKVMCVLVLDRVVAAIRKDIHSIAVYNFVQKICVYPDIFF